MRSLSLQAKIKKPRSKARILVSGEDFAEFGMRKAKVRSMQRGAQKRSGKSPIRMQDIYKKHPPKIASADKPHLDFLKYGKPEQIVLIRAVIEAAKKNGIGTASEISRILNKMLIKTAIGEKWTPRLAWFAAAAVKAHNLPHEVRAPGRSIEKQSRTETKFRDMVNRVVKSRFKEISSEIEASTPTLGEALPELAALKRRLEGSDE